MLELVNSKSTKIFEVSIPDIFESRNDQELPLLPWVTLLFKYNTCFISRDTRQLHQTFLWKVYGNNLLSPSESGRRKWKYLILMEMIPRGLTWRNHFVIGSQPKGNRCLREIAPSIRGHSAKKQGSLAKCMLLAIISSDMARRQGRKRKKIHWKISSTRPH